MTLPFFICRHCNKLIFIGQCAVDTVGAGIARPAHKCYVFASVFGKSVILYCAGVVRRAANQNRSIASGDRTIIQ